MLRSLAEGMLAGEELCLGFVEGQHMALSDHLGQILLIDVDPQIHGVGRHELRGLDLLE